MKKLQHGHEKLAGQTDSRMDRWKDNKHTIHIFCDVNAVPEV
jgi:hypothetical protein